MSDVELTPTGATPAPRASSAAAWKLLAALLAIACAVLAFLLLRPAEEAEVEAGVGPTATAASTGALACEVLGEASAVPDDEAASDEAFVEQLRFGVAGTLGMMAEAQDASYAEFAKHLQGPGQAHAQTFSMESPEFQEALELAVSTCADRFPTDE